MPVSRDTPPHNLDLVIDFVNTLDLETGVDRIATPAGLRAWLRDEGQISDEGPAPDAADVTEAIALREALRSVLLAHTRGAADGDGGPLERVAGRGQLAARFAPDGSMRIAPRADGFPGVLAGLLVPVAYAAMDGTWQRVKACDAADCLEAFYDQSRNRSGRWCDMALCGNRTKVRSYRTRQTR